MDVWLGGGGEKNVVGLRSFLSKPTKMFSPQNGEKTKVGLRSFLSKPTKMFSPQNGEKTKVKSLICLLIKMLMHTYT